MILFSQFSPHLAVVSKPRHFCHFLGDWASWSSTSKMSSQRQDLTLASGWGFPLGIPRGGGSGSAD